MSITSTKNGLRGRHANVSLSHRPVAISDEEACPVLLRLAENQFGPEFTRGVKAAKAALATQPGSIVAHCLVVRSLYLSGSNAVQEKLELLRHVASQTASISEDSKAAIREIEHLCTEPERIVVETKAEAKRIEAEYLSKGKRFIIEVVPPKASENTMTLEQFEAHIKKIRWMTNCGKPNHRDQTVKRIASWDDWVGPESEGCDRLNDIIGIWQEQVIQILGERAEKALGHANKIESRVYDTVKKAVPHKSDDDIWFAPNAAVALSAYSAKLVALYVIAGAPLPDMLADLWQWFAEGHWPCSCAFGSDDDDILVVL
ncbi:MAG: hypothetical protein K2W95_06320 [Candidatus Obscuribacterales bacterium]|nr:hypothetical protein [Candidatus Obscuribacterales bacterium]